MNLGKTAISVLGTVAPTILTAIGGPFGALAGAALHAALGTNGDDKLIDQSLTGATQDTLLKVKQAEIDFKAKMAEIGLQTDQLTYTDVQDARKMHTATRDPTAARLAWLLIGGFITVSIMQLIAMVGYADQINKIPSQGWLLIGNLVGYLASEAKQAGAFYFGSTQASQNKDSTIAEIAKS